MLCAKLLQSCPTLCDPMDCNPPGSSIHGDSPGQNTDLLQGLFPTQGLNPRLCSCISRWVLYTSTLVSPRLQSRGFQRVDTTECMCLHMHKHTHTHTSLTFPVQKQTLTHFTVPQRREPHLLSLSPSTQIGKDPLCHLTRVHS